MRAITWTDTAGADGAERSSPRASRNRLARSGRAGSCADPDGRPATHARGRGRVHSNITRV